MSNYSIIKIITFFFFFIFIIINTLFFIAREHFIKEQEADRMHRFGLAGRLIHRSSGNFDEELKHLLITPSNLSLSLIQKEGKKLSEFPFGKIIEYKQRVYFIKTPPPLPPLEIANLLPPPPPPKHFDNFVLEDLKKESLWLLWVTFVSIDLLILLFFGYIIKKLLPLHNLKNAIVNFSDQDSFLNLPISGRDEISQITKEFNIVLQKIASMRQARSLFLRNILHELKTPIMKGLLTTECLESSEHQERLKQIFERMNYLLGEFSKMECFNSGEWQLNFQEYRFVDLLDHACDLLLCDKNSLVIIAQEKSLLIDADFELFTVALKNIIDNAFKYSNEKPILSVLANSIKICSKGDMLCEENKIFTKPFNRSYENSNGGLGLGLYITDAILKKHNYKLDYSYALGVNCFEIILNTQGDVN
ncbi:MAG: ArsS family sensor histidine kinase [Sulfurimonas sp.]|uniref:ArsS family sensor histidine kinase n=1 Tax=Sulfurimonas sp. TaxID=2022749 RepID=UPI003D0D65F3